MILALSALLACEGDPCQSDADCEASELCAAGRCERPRGEARQEHLLHQSSQGPAVRTPGAVIVRRASGREPLFAACLPDERLLSGGCSADAATEIYVQGYPSGYSESDTLGARWICELGPGISTSTTYTAYALCLYPEAPATSP